MKAIDKKLGNLDVVIEKSSGVSAKKLAEDLSDYLTIAKNNKINILLLLSGGSAFSILDFIIKDSLGSNLTIGVLDERYDKTNKNNNFTQLTKTEFYKSAKNAGCNFIDTSVRNGQSQESLAEYFETMLTDWQNKNPSGEIVATLGVGSDGHTSGIMPFPENRKLFEQLFESKKFVVAYDAFGKNSFPKRITTTISFLRKLKIAWCFITGESKADVYFRMYKEIILNEMPAQIIKELHGAVYIDNSVLKM